MKWTTLRHNGVAFPPPEEYRGLTIKIKGESLKLDPLQEEMLMAWAKKKDTPYVQDPVFQQNFLGDLKKQLPSQFANISLSDIDFTKLHAIADREKTANLPPEEKKKRSAERKALRDELKAKFGTAQVDGTEVEVGAYLVEPPGILMGRGAHPLRGKWKRRIEPEDVTLNLDADAPAPPAPKGHAWKEIVHEHDSLWVASWYDELSDKRKYIWLAETSHLRQERDKEKYEKAQKLETAVERVRERIRERMDHEDKNALATMERSETKLRAERQKLQARILQANEVGDKEKQRQLEDELALLKKEQETLEKKHARIHAAQMKERQIATVCYLIDRLAMRVGDEKDEDEADTVGASTLRVEHVHIHPDHIEFDFLGKDSVHWNKPLPLDDKEKILAHNLQDFMRDKQPGDQIFDQIDSTNVNHNLSSELAGLTANLFRTYHATQTVRGYLEKNGLLSPEATAFEKEFVAKKANLEAAIQCNHKRTPPKNWEQNLAKKAELAEKLRKSKPDVEKLRAQIPAREAALKKLLEQQKRFEAAAPRALRQKEAALAKLQAKKIPKKNKDAAKHKRKINAAAKALAKAKKDLERKRKRFPDRIEKAKQALEKARLAPARSLREYAERVGKAVRQHELAVATRDYNLGTSLKNYIDPRVFKAWGDHVGFDWSRLYTTALRRKFAWVNQSRVKWA